MITVNLPDGTSKKISAPVTGTDAAKELYNQRFKDVIALLINGNLADLNANLSDHDKISFVMRDDPESLEIIRHDAAHIMAEAVQELYPGTQVTIGPVIENGFYYDFALEKPFTEDDLILIENKMHEIVDRREEIQREIWDREDGINFFKEKGEHFKCEIINSIDKNEKISLYRQGKFIDLCKGPHLPNTSYLGKGFKLLKVAGAYWRGDSSKPMLQRIYGTAWRNPKELRLYLKKIEEAEKRDHRVLGKNMNLFHFQAEAPGAVFWHNKGWTLFQNLINFMRNKQNDAGYIEINTPDIMDISLWEASGHKEKFGENMFTTEAKEERVYALKPMNCPGHVQVFKQGLKSYRDLPLKFSEFGKVHRYEPSGALHGLMRVRAFTQDDAHIFCTEDQITNECLEVCKLVLDIYKDFGFEDVHIKFSDRPVKRVGNDDIWEKSEKALLTAINETGLPYKLNSGEGAFYGPKLEFVLRDAIGRDWQCGTLQVDLNLPELLTAYYIGEDGKKHRPVMLHRALFGSIERFLGILIEHYAGNLPLWLTPTQVVAASITSEANKYTSEVEELFKSKGIRIISDLRNEKIGYKIREHSLSKVPIILAIGEKEITERTVSIRKLGTKKNITLPLEEALKNTITESQIKK
ncbi:threonine--tRNA ligase [Alphaproteobacteria bacterium]|nr:threonine--tRNA ligase [Alphaproteobacteria bacterium]